MDEKFTKPYNHKETEDRVYSEWERGGYFKPEHNKNKNAKPYCMVFPPPNVTGVLHMGHAATVAIEDILIRYHRMAGFKTLWIPGTDSAAIATQARVEKELYKKEKKTRYDLGREGFLNYIESFANSSHDAIVKQVRKLGGSLDWDREAYTLDEVRTHAVTEAFKRMYNAGLIYRGKRIVNWDPKLQTTVSDDEIVRVEERAPFYYLKYGPFEIATARPETKFGDKYVVMHPYDVRYKKYKHSQKINLEWINGPITATIIKDEAIDMEFGTGVMTITPWHDQTDFDIAKRHNLDMEQIIDLNGKLLPIAKEFSGLYINKARPLIVEKLKEKGLLTKIDKSYVHNIATNGRGGGVLEPQILKQWFIAVKKEFEMPHSEIKGIKKGDKITLNGLMRHVVSSNQVKIYPERFNKIYFNWIDNLRDWCISRQIWFGHRIPVWYHENKCIPREGKEKDISKCIDVIIAGQEPKCEFCDAKYIQDPDTLDTWFSSGLWTFSTMGWPDNTEDLKTFHPTNILETGYDILFFWIARMILQTGFLLGQVPFHEVYLHGLVRDEHGIKMSKSLGNIIDPLDMIEKYGADATRMSLIVGSPPGGDINLSEDKIRAYKHFANKVWNASRFVFINTKDYKEENIKLTAQDEKYLEELHKIISETTEDITSYRFYLAAEKLYHYFWHTFADIIIEETKNRIHTGTEEEKLSAQYTLITILTTLLKLLHPFMPFITEELWRLLPFTSGMLIVTPWPSVQ